MIMVVSGIGFISLDRCSFYFKNSSTGATKIKRLSQQSVGEHTHFTQVNFPEEEKTGIFPYLKEIGQASKICLTDKGKRRRKPQSILESKREKIVNLIETLLNM